MPVVADQATPMSPEILDNLAQPEEGKGKWGKAKGRGKGKGGEERSGKGKAAAPAASQEQPVRSKGRGSGEAGSGGSGGGTKWVVRTPQTHDSGGRGEGQAGPGNGSSPPVTSATYKHDFRKYDRADFEKVSGDMRGEQLEEPASVRLLGDEIPIFRETPSVELAAE